VRQSRTREVQAEEAGALKRSQRSGRLVDIEASASIIGRARLADAGGFDQGPGRADIRTVRRDAAAACCTVSGSAL
jgi:hypothetical protein